MKSRKDLEQISWKIVESYLAGQTGDYPKVNLMQVITDALACVQDEALKEGFPVLSAKLSAIQSNIKPAPQIEEMPVTKLKPEVKTTPWQHACELCGSPVKIVGETTQHYEPVESIQRYTTRMPSWEALKEYMREIGSSKFNDPSIEIAYQWIKTQMTGEK